MDSSVKATLSAAVDIMASNMGPTWLSNRNWLINANVLIDLIIKIGGNLEDDELATLISIAALCRRQAVSTIGDTDLRMEDGDA